MHSSYAVNNFKDVFKAVVSAYQPKVCVELGVLEGYSAIAIGEALKGTSGFLNAYDLFEDYLYRHSTMPVVIENLKTAGVLDYVALHKEDAFEVHQHYDFNSVDFLHVDLSNTGETLRKIIDLWDNRLVQGGVILFEGGSEERDHIEWMEKYEAPSIKKECETNPVIRDKYVFGTYFRYPSLTCLLKKR